MFDGGEISDLLVSAGLADRAEPISAEPFTGGVSSDVLRVQLPGRQICLKRAIPRLRVAAEWRAPVDRSHNEVLWLRRARSAGLHVPEVLAEWPDRHAFAMTCFDPDDYRVWKAALASGTAQADTGLQVGRALGRMHQTFMDDRETAALFADDTGFRALRIDPFIIATAERHPHLRGRLHALAERTLATRRTLVHGDVSPKNILVGPGEPVILDAECAWYGDPAFDLAFCSTHLLLKSVWKPEHSALHRASLNGLARGYFEEIAEAERGPIEARTMELVAALLLARVDGKSPAEYLDDDGRTLVRSRAQILVETPATDFAALTARWHGSGE